MNPVDHPHGGGEGKTSGGRHPVSPWGKPTKGFKTRKKNKKSNSSYFFEDPILGWAGNENSKKRFKSKYDLWTLQSTFKWANKKINKNKNNKKENSKIMIDKFFKLSSIKKTKIYYSLNHGWRYYSNSRPFKIKSYWDPRKRLGVCADWFVGPRLESGWISAHDLFRKISRGIN